GPGEAGPGATARTGGSARRAVAGSAAAVPGGAGLSVHGAVPDGRTASGAAAHPQMPAARLGHGAGAVARHPPHDHPARRPPVTGRARKRITPPLWSAICSHASIRTRVLLPRTAKVQVRRP